MKKEPLSLAHRPLLDPLLKALRMEITEYSFANLYLFRATHQYEVLFDEQIYIAGKTRDGFSYVTPLKPVSEWNHKQIEMLLKEYDFLFPMPEHEIDPNLYEWTHSDADSDYVYAIDTLRYYPGRHLDGRRNLVRQFNEKYPDHHSHPLDHSRVPDALNLLENWKKDVYADYEPCREALQLMDELQLNGWIVYATDQAVAFTIGEWLTPEMYIVQFAKALVEYKGVYQFLYEDAALHINTKTRYINLEQDLGIEALRRSKEAYHPDRKLRKLRVRLKK